ncbi:NADP-dependent oxidoreductase domain-containing protein [Daldinia bambusicola]|nr:NADP-dependent oxidoreductase domain-containing protein [Daldinia bambusicola]
MVVQGKPHIILGLMIIGPEGSPGARMTNFDDFKKALDIFQRRGYHELDTARLPLREADRSVPFVTTLEAVDRLHKAGKFSLLGLSNYASLEVAEIVMTYEHNGTVEDELVPTCRRYGIAIDVYSPTGGGFLLGRITSKNDDPKEERYHTSI